VGLATSSLAASWQNQATSDRARDRLTHQIRHELITLPFYNVFDWLEFELKPDGTVVLSGYTVRPTTKSDAGNRVKDLEGVEQVVNNIEVLPLSPNDDRIRRAVYRTLFNFNSPLFRYGQGVLPSIHIIVKNGHVTLRGLVNNRADSNLANIRTRGVPGVFSVTNELQTER
jgi:hyperosmotically inducible protein